MKSEPDKRKTTDLVPARLCAAADALAWIAQAGNRFLDAGEPFKGHIGDFTHDEIVEAARFLTRLGIPAPHVP